MSKIKKNQIESIEISQVDTLQTELDTKINSDPTGITGADQVTNVVSLTQAEYNAIWTPSADTQYLITDA